MEYTVILTNIRKILRSLNLESKKIQKDYGVSIPQLMCLDLLGNTKGYQATQISIAKSLNLNASTISGIIDRLEIKGFVAKLPNPNDKRSVLVSLTTKGAKLLALSPQLLHERLTKRLEKLPPQEVKKIIDALNILVDCFDIGDISASPILTIEELMVNQSEKSSEA